MSTLVATRADMSNIAALFGGEAWQVIVIARLQTQMLWLLCSGRWPNDDERVQSWGGQFHIMHVCPRHHRCQRQSMSITQGAALGPVLAAIRRVVSDALVSS